MTFRPYGITSLKTVIFTIATVETLNLTGIILHNRGTFTSLVRGIYWLMPSLRENFLRKFNS